MPPPKWRAGHKGRVRAGPRERIRGLADRGGSALRVLLVGAGRDEFASDFNAGVPRLRAFT
eukprot:8081501-Lingulodinium_polyedra.AAC.1